MVKQQMEWEHKLQCLNSEGVMSMMATKGGDSISLTAKEVVSNKETELKPLHGCGGFSNIVRQYHMLLTRTT